MNRKAFGSAAALIAILGAGTSVAPLALADEVPPQAQPSDSGKVDPPGGKALDLTRHKTGSVGDAGQFPGKLVCLRSKESFAPLSASECSTGARVYALELDGESQRHPIQAGSPEIESQLQANLGKEVVVQGKFQNATGTVMAASVREQRPDERKN